MQAASGDRAKAWSMHVPLCPELWALKFQGTAVAEELKDNAGKYAVADRIYMGGIKDELFKQNSNINRSSFRHGTADGPELGRTWRQHCDV